MAVRARSLNSHRKCRETMASRRASRLERGSVSRSTVRSSPSVPAQSGALAVGNAAAGHSPALRSAPLRGGALSAVFQESPPNPGPFSRPADQCCRNQANGIRPRDGCGSQTSQTRAPVELYRGVVQFQYLCKSKRLHQALAYFGICEITKPAPAATAPAHDRTAMAKARPHR